MSTPKDIETIVGQPDETTIAVEERLAEKVRYRKARKYDRAEKQSATLPVPKKHWANHAGTYRDPELLKGPKHYRSHKPILVHKSIHSYVDMKLALESIAASEKHFDQYAKVDGINRDRLRLAQSLHDQEIKYSSREIAKMNQEQIKQYTANPLSYTPLPPKR